MLLENLEDFSAKDLNLEDFCFNSPLEKMLREIAKRFLLLEEKSRNMNIKNIRAATFFLIQFERKEREGIKMKFPCQQRQRIIHLR